MKRNTNGKSADYDAFFIPRSVQKSIPIKRIYKDGIFEVSGRFSKSWRFCDINYQVASPEKQSDLFLSYSAFLNSLPIHASAKITLFNRRLNRDTFGSELLMQMKPDGLDIYREEYNDCKEPDRLIDLADKILTCWRGYTDEAATVFAETDGEPHNTITPIVRKNGEQYELDLVLRNNLTTKEHPLGLYHPHAEKHHIKKENIGLIEVMGLAVLPARLSRELADLQSAILEDRDIRSDEVLSKHADWVEELKKRYIFTPENTEAILQIEVGAVFTAVLEDAGVYKRTAEGKAGVWLAEKWRHGSVHSCR